MAKDRILGSAAKIELYNAANSTVMAVEVDNFSASQKHEIKTWHPLGEIGERQQVIYKGWDMSFKTGKTDSGIADFFKAIDDALLAGQPAPRVRVTETVKHYDGNNEIWIYPDTVLYGYTANAANSEDEISEDFKGACTTRTKG